MLKKFSIFVRTVLIKLKRFLPHRRRKVKLREREPNCIIFVGAPIETLEKAVKIDIRVPDMKPVTIDVGHCCREIRFATTVDRIRFKGSPYDIYVIFTQACNNLFGSNTYRAGEVVYFDRNNRDVVFREPFMICADIVQIRPPQPLGSTANSNDIARSARGIGDMVMYEPATFGYRWVDLMWGRDICTMEAIRRHFRNPRHIYSPTEEDIFEKRCDKFFRICNATVTGKMHVVL